MYLILRIYNILMYYMPIIDVVYTYLDVVFEIFNLEKPGLEIFDDVSIYPTYVDYDRCVIKICRGYLNFLQEEFYNTCMKICREFLKDYLDIFSISLRPLTSSVGLLIMYLLSNGEFKTYLTYIKNLIKRRDVFKDENLLDSIYSTIFMVSELLPSCFSELISRSLAYVYRNVPICSIILSMLGDSKQVNMLRSALIDYVSNNVSSIVIKPIMDVLDVIIRGFELSDLVSCSDVIKICRILSKIRSSLVKINYTVSLDKSKTFQNI